MVSSNNKMPNVSLLRLNDLISSVSTFFFPLVISPNQWIDISLIASKQMTICVVYIRLVILERVSIMPFKYCVLDKLVFVEGNVVNEKMFDLKGKDSGKMFKSWQRSPSAMLMKDFRGPFIGRHSNEMRTMFEKANIRL